MPTEIAPPTALPMNGGEALLAPPPLLRLPKRKQRSLTVDREAVVEDVLRRLREDCEDRQEWLEAHLRRYAKYRGWMERQEWQFNDASNAHIPITMYHCQRLQDTLVNAVLAQRPTMQAQAAHRTDTEKEARIDRIMDAQLYTAAGLDRLLPDAVQNLVVEPAMHLFVGWARQTHPIRHFWRMPAAPPGSDVRQYVTTLLAHHLGLDPSQIGDPDGHRWTVLDAANTPHELEVYEGVDGDYEIVEREDVSVEHVQCSVLDLEDVVVPAGCINPQPPSESNPRGAHHVTKLCRASLDTVIARHQSKIYDLLTKDDLETITAWAEDGAVSGDDDLSAPRVQKDDLEGVHTVDPSGGTASLPVIEVYDRYDVDGDGLEEDVIWWIVTNQARTEGRLARARYLTEIYPPGPTGPRRPIVKWCLFPVTNRYYGIGLPELIEGLQDLINRLFNLGVDFGVLTNAPFFFYRASSGLKPEVMRLNPGEGYPLDDPNADVHFPQLPNNQGSWIFNELAMLNQFVERTTMYNDLNFGQVPTGKSAALRTAASMQQILHQTDIRSERILRRLLDGLADVWDMALTLVQRYLPPGTEYRMIGAPNTNERFEVIQNREEIAGRFRFTFRASFLQANPGARLQMSTTLLQALAAPLFLQAGIVTPEGLYAAVRQFIEALQESNPDQYITRPPQATGPKRSAADVVTMILHGAAPGDVNPVEPLAQHLDALMRFLASPDALLLSPQHGQWLKEYLDKALALLQQQQQQMALAQMAAQHAPMMPGAQPGTPGPPASGAPASARGISPASPAAVPPMGPPQPSRAQGMI